MTELFNVEHVVNRSEVRGLPVFVGYTAKDEKIVLYMRSETEFHLQVPGGEIWAMGPDSAWEYSHSCIDFTQQLTVDSPMWKGVAMGNRAFVVAEDRMMNVTGAILKGVK